MDDISDYTALLTSYHRDKPNLTASIEAVLLPLLQCRNVLQQMPSKFDVSTATGDQLKTIAQWVGAPASIPNVTPLPFFGFADQELALTFGETDDPDIGGKWRESGINSYAAADIPDELLLSVIAAQIYRNHCNCVLSDGYHIVQLLTSVPVRVTDNMNMSINVGFQASVSKLMLELVKLMYPRPMGIALTVTGI